MPKFDSSTIQRNNPDTSIIYLSKAVGWVSDSVTQRNARWCWVSLPQPNLRENLLSVNQVSTSVSERE